MSTLWTPSGEHPVPPRPSGKDPRPGPASSGPGAGRPAAGRPITGGANSGGPGTGPEGGPQRGADDGDYPEVQYTQEELRQAEQEMDAVRQQLLRAPVEVVIANHAMGLWELAALHLSQDPPGLREAKMAIDAMGALLDGLAGQLGEPERTLAEGLSQIRLAFVQIASSDRDKGSTSR